MSEPQEPVDDEDDGDEEQLPIVELITRNIETTLASVTMPERFWLHPTDSVTVLRPTKTGEYSPRHLQMVLVQGDPTRATDLDIPGNPPAVGWRQAYSVNCVIIVAERSSWSIDEAANIFWANVVKTVSADPQRGGLANDTVLLAPQLWREIGYEGITVEFDVIYRCAENDPCMQM